MADGEVDRELEVERVLDGWFFSIHSMMGNLENRLFELTEVLQKHQNVVGPPKVNGRGAEHSKEL